MIICEKHLVLITNWNIHILNDKSYFYESENCQNIPDQRITVPGEKESYLSAEV